MTFAKIEKGVVANTIKADAAFAARAGFVEIPEGFGIGDLYDAAQKKFTKAPPVPPVVVAELTKGQLTARVTQLQNQLDALAAQVAAL